MDQLRISRGIPQANPDTNPASIRGGRYGEIITMPLMGKKHVAADEGSYFVATNPTPATAVATTTSIVTFAETAGAVGVVMLLKNNDAISSQMPKRLYLDYIKLMIVQVPTSATSWQFALVIDNNPVRYTSGGSAITPVNPNGDVNPSSIAQLYFGALTTAVPNNRRLVARGTLRGVIPTTFDEFTILSGGVEGGSGFASAAASGKSVNQVPPIILGAQQNLALTLWGASNAAAPSYEFEMGWLER
jgi:hypothetical protein